MTLSERIGELIKRHGSLRAAARVISVDAGYLSRLASGEKAQPLKPVLDKLGLRRVVTYERKTSPAASGNAATARSDDK